MANEIYYIGANDEHGLNPPTAGKRTPLVPGLNRYIFENEFNKEAKRYFIEALLRNSFSVYDVKPETRDISLSERVRRVNRQNLTLLVTFAYNAFGEEFNSVSGVETFYSPLNSKAESSRRLAQDLYNNLLEGTSQRGRGVKSLNVRVLSSVNCPSALIEAGFMTNLQEAQRMINPLYQIEVGEEACKGVCDYLDVEYIPRNDLANYPTLRVGSEGNFVYLLQYILNLNGANLTVDGDFGTRTKNAVTTFQQNNSLSADGVAGKNTWKTLLTLPAYPVLRRGNRGAFVRFAQQLLKSNLIPVGTIDGIFGVKTTDAVRSFQAQRGLTQDGIVGPNTWLQLSQIN